MWNSGGGSEMDLGVPQGWNSWSALKGRRRHPVRLSASVDSIPYADNDFFSSVGSLSNYPDFDEDDGSVNNILDALGDRTSSATALCGASWSVLDQAGSSPSSGNDIRMAELSVVAKCDESSGVGSGGSSGGPGTNSSASPTGSSLPQNEEYEHVYCQLDPYFSPPINNLTKSQPIVSPGNVRFSTRASIRSWGMRSTSSTMDRDPGIIPFLQQALAVRYREMLDTYLQAPPWYRQHLGMTDLDEICPVVYQVVPEKSGTIYGTTTSKKLSAERQHDSYKPILPHQIFAKAGEEELSRAFWLEGDPGSGKTLLSLKLVSEWVAYHSYNYTSSPLNTRLGEFQVLFYVPLREVRGSLSRFLMRELIPKRSILSRMKPANVWKCLNLLGNSMLLVLDGLDDVADEELLKEIQDVLNGQMFPQCMVLVTTSPGHNSPSSSCPGGPIRKFFISGMDWTQIQCLVRRYFTGRKCVPGNESRMAEILSDRHDLCALASNPFMCLLLCSVLDQVGDLPCSNSEFYSALVASLIYQNLPRGDSLSPSKESSIPPKYQKMLQEFGKLALSKLSSNKRLNRVNYFESELPDSDIIKTGILSRPKGFFRGRKSSAAPLPILHPSLSIFFAAYYLATTVNYPNLLRREMELLPGLEALAESQVKASSNLAFQVIELVMELLQKKAASLFSLMNLLDISINYLLALLRAAGFYETNLSAVCSIMKSMKHVSINVSSEWVSEWKQVITSTHCPFESCELLIKPGFSLSRLIEGLCLNESISSVKFSSVPGQDWSGNEVKLICGQLLRLLSEKKLKCLEISMTCLEDKEHSRFQPVVDALCYVLSKRVPLKKLVLDMDLTSSQVLQLVSFIKVHPHLEILHVPHLGCGPEGFRALSDLLRDKPLLSLSLAGTWRSTDTDEDLETILETPFNPFSSTQKLSVFSSLPRGGPGNGLLSGSMKSPSIRRKKTPLSHLSPEDKRNSDSSLFQRNFLPVPICDKENHEVDGFHGIFAALRAESPAGNLRNLNLSKCVMNWEDVICLGETIRKTKCLDSLRMEGMKLCDVLPVLLGLQENGSLKMVDLSSPHVVIGDDAIQLACSSLAKNRSLRLLSIQGWTFYIEDEKSLDSLESVFRSSNLQDLDLTGVRIHMSSNKKIPPSNSNTLKNGSLSLPNGAKNPEKDKKATLDQKSFFKGEKMRKASLSSVLNISGLKKLCSDLSFLRIGGMEIKLKKTETWRSMDILYHLGPYLDKGKITHLDISLDKNEASGVGSPINNNNNTGTVEERLVLKTMKMIGMQFPRLQSLVVNHWRMKLSEKSCKEVGKYLGNLEHLSFLNFDHSTISAESASSTNNSPNQHHYQNNASNLRRIDHFLFSSVLSNLKSIAEFSWANFDSNQMSQLGKVITSEARDRSFTLKLELVPLPSIKSLIAYSTSKSNSSGVVVEYAGNHTISIHRPTKDRNEHLMYKLKRLL